MADDGTPTPPAELGPKLELELIESDAYGYCDATTGVCAVPEAAGLAPPPAAVHTLPFPHSTR
jgi:hypothetical protein